MALPSTAGRNLGMRPMEMVLTGHRRLHRVRRRAHPAQGPAAGCRLRGDRGSHAGRGRAAVFTAIHLVYKVAGRGLALAQVERAVKLSKEKYCSATIMLAKTAAITYEIALFDADRVPVEA